MAKSRKASLESAYRGGHVRGESKIPTLIKITDEMRRDLKAAAQAQKLNSSEFIRRALAYVLSNGDRVRDAVELQRLLRA